MSDEHWSAIYDSARAARVEAVGRFGFTDRQARFLVTVMAHSGSFLERQYCAFAGIARGQNSREFVGRLVGRGFATAVTPGSVRRGRIYHLHHRPLYEAIGEMNNRHRKPQTIGRMVQRLMILDGVLGDRHCWWMGTENDKRTFFATTRQMGIASPDYPQIAFGSGPQKTVRYFPDKLPIGIRKRDLSQHVFLYLVTKPLPVDFRQFLLRHAELFRVVGTWTVRLLVPRPFWSSIALYKGAVRDELWTPMEPSITDQLESFFRDRRQAGGHISEASDASLAKAFRRYGTARVASLYRAWRCRGDEVLWAAHSPILRDARSRGWGACEIELLPGQYLQLAGSIASGACATRGAKQKHVQVGPPLSSVSLDDVPLALVAP